jgi:hypothetical protein
MVFSWWQGPGSHSEAGTSEALQPGRGSWTQGESVCQTRVVTKYNLLTMSQNWDCTQPVFAALQKLFVPTSRKNLYLQYLRT